MGKGEEERDVGWVWWASLYKRGWEGKGSKREKGEGSRDEEGGWDEEAIRRDVVWGKRRGVKRLENEGIWIMAT